MIFQDTLISSQANVKSVKKVFHFLPLKNNAKRILSLVLNFSTATWWMLKTLLEKFQHINLNILNVLPKKGILTANNVNHAIFLNIGISKKMNANHVKMVFTLINILVNVCILQRVKNSRLISMLKRKFIIMEILKM